mgnify:CR=1 FL=1
MVSNSITASLFSFFFIFLLGVSVATVLPPQWWHIAIGCISYFCGLLKKEFNGSWEEVTDLEDGSHHVGLVVR